MSDNISARGLKIYQDNDNSHSVIEEYTLDSIRPKEVIIQVHYSGINYKDALAVTGKAKILRKSPLVGGIDLAGQIVESMSSNFKVGDNVIITGSGLSEVLDGGFATYAKAPEDIVVALPKTLSIKQAMLIGTAGFTAALAIHKMEHNGQSPEQGEIIVSGASGGVGSFAIHILHRRGYQAVASTRKQNTKSYLINLGATRVIDSIEPVSGDLAKSKWAGAIDSLGGETLETLLKQTKPSGNIVSIGLAQSPKIQTTVIPWIIRGINLLGVTSSNCPMSLKRDIWRALGEYLRPSDECFSEVLTKEIPLSEIQSTNWFERILAGQIFGRILINCQR